MPVVILYCFLLVCIKLISSQKTTKSQKMESHSEDDGLFYMGAQTEWLPAEHFMNINNWDDSVKPSAAHYIKQVEEWIVSKEGDELAQVGDILDMLHHTMSNPMNVVVNEEQEEEQTTEEQNVSPSIILPKSTSNTEIGSDTLKLHSSTIDRAKPLACSECGKILSSKKNLTQHLRIHSGEKPFACIQCGTAFKRKDALSRHVSVVHNGEKPYVCCQCGKTFSEKNKLTRHVRVHSGENSGEKPFPCSQCGKAFAQSSDLNRHLRVHSGEKPFSCSECGKAFARSNTLTRHVRIHSGEKPFKCEKCGKSFTRSSYRNQHAKKCNSR